MVEIRSVQYTVLTAEEFKQFGPVKIDTPFNKGSKNIEGTPYDLRLGALENGVPCGTCGELNNVCPGHFGYIELPSGCECYNTEYINIILGIFKCICLECKSPRISKDSASIFLSSKGARFKAYKRKAELLKQCSVCQNHLPQFFLDKFEIKYFYTDKKKAVSITATEAYSILMQISSETMKLLGFNEDLPQNQIFLSDEIILLNGKTHIHEIRPEAYIYSVLPVLPTCARPWVVRGSEKKDDDITDTYNIILKIISKLENREEKKTKRGASHTLTESDRTTLVNDLHSIIRSLIDNSKEGKIKNNNRHRKGIRERIGTKEGHIQSHVAGKRVDYTSRTVVVGGGSLLPMGWIGVPQVIAEKITIPEHVTEWNINEWEHQLKEGKVTAVVRQGYTIRVLEATKNGTVPFSWKGVQGLQVRDIVHRQTRDGDWQCLNRQPTLRIESMQGVQAKIIPGEFVFRIPLGMTRPLNMDFDGDEANTHSAQTIGGRVECSVISRVAFMIVSAQNNAPVMGCVQNTLICMYLLTETFLTPESNAETKSTITFDDGTKGYETIIDHEDAMAAIELARVDGDRFKDLLTRAKKYYPKYIKTTKTGELKLAEKIPGKLLVSIVFPRNFTWSRKTGTNEKFPDVSIKNGIIQPKSGPLCKKIIGGISGSAIHALWRITPDTALNFISELQFIGCYMIERLGFSMGVSDILPTRLDEIKAAVDEALIKCELINASQQDIDDKEREINGALNEAAGVAPKLAKTSMNKGDRNSLVIMQKSGAKGSVANNGQISGFVGQQNMDGKRMKYMLCSGTRTLPHFTRNDNSPESRGFVQHSYLEGLTFKEAWFHAAAGRRGVIDTAMKSVTYDTEIFVLVRGRAKNVKIGTWIDEILAENDPIFTGESIEYFADRKMEMLSVKDVKIPTCDEKGNVFWGEVTHVTRHDPSDTLYKITTESGRTVTVAESKSLLVWNGTILEQLDATLVKIGDLLPVSINTPEIGVEIMNMKIYTREEGFFRFDKENGLIIGLYLSTGTYRQDEGLEFAVYNYDFGRLTEEWFYKNNISFEAKKEVNFPSFYMAIKCLGYKISNVEKFISRWIFRSGRKVIPDETFSAPKEFIVGLLDSYFKNVGEIFLSQELTTGIAILCSIVGYTVNIKGNMLCSLAKDVNVKSDIWLDPVTSIEKINGRTHKYVYDLTVPSTTNFGISNGLIVVDTADSGYLQKKLVKKIEDCSIWDDGTIRDVNESIVQFMYGGDGIEAKNLIYCRGVDYPIFCDPYMIASLLNTEAGYAKDDGNDIGEMRTMTKSEIDMLCSFIKSGCPGVQTEVTERTTFNTRVLLRSIISKVEICESMIPRFCSNIRDEYEGGKAKKGYMAGLIAASSMGEVTTQLTLNSLDYKEIVYIRKGNGIILGPIGQFIDNIIESYPKDKIQKLPNRQLYVDVSDEGYEMTSVDENGKMHWKTVEGVTRHLPGGKLIKVKTHFGKEVVATKGMSFLTRKKNKIVATAGSDLKVGDHLPVMLNYPETKTISHIDLKQYLPPESYIYTSEMNKAWKERGDDYKGSPGWFLKNGKKFKIPFNRGDSFSTSYRRLILSKPSKFKEGCVYPKSSCQCVSEIPEKLPLDYETGFLFGAHIAEGCVTKTFVCISNNDKKFRQMIYDWCDRYKIGHHTVEKISRQFENSRGMDIKIHSTLLAKVLGDCCGRGSANKKIPDWSLIAPKKFIRGLLNGYFSGDGTVEKKSGNVKCASASKTLIYGICELLTRFGIYGHISMNQAKSNNVGSEIILPSYVLDLRGNNADKFAKKISSVIPEKHRRLQEITLEKKRMYGGEGRIRNIPIYKNGKEKLVHFQDIMDSEDDDLLRHIDQDVFYDPIVSIEDVECSTEWVYDFTISDTRNFSTFGGLQVRDSFHSTGMSAKDVTLGVPRLKELLNVTKNPSRPGCTVYLTDEELKKYEDDAKNDIEKETNEKKAIERVTKLANSLVDLKVDYFVKKYELQYLLLPKEKLENKTSPVNLINYQKYEKKWWVRLAEDLGNAPTIEPDSWVIILDLDLDKMYRYGVTTKKIAKKIEKESMKTMGCLPSPTNIAQIEIYLNFSDIRHFIGDKFSDQISEDASPDEKMLITHDNIDYFTTREVAIDLIKKTTVQGVSGITKTFIRQDLKTKEWLIDTQGTNLAEILSRPEVDQTRTMSDDLWEVYNVLGLEAARILLIEETIKILSFDGTYVNPRHITILADSMCKNAILTGANRDGISRDVGPVAKSMFEKAVDNLAEASAFGEYDNMKGVASSVMFGTLPRVGTGTVEIKNTEQLPVEKNPVKLPVKKRGVVK